VLLAGLITVLCILILCKGGKPCYGIGIWKIELGPDVGVEQIRLFVNELLDPFLASLYLRALWNARHVSLPNNLHM